MQDNLKILHLASFNGNIGDNVSQMGFHNLLKTLHLSPQITRLEMRKFYDNYKESDKRFFNQDFIDEINSYDLCICGGGGFLSYNRESSLSGTTFNCNPNLWQGLKTPLLFASMGCNFYHDKNRLSPPLQKETKINFLRLLESFLQNPKIHIFLRNDGSFNVLKEEFGEKYTKGLQEVIDNGFFYLQEFQNDFLKDKKYLAINVISREQSDDMQWQSHLKNLTQIIEYVIENLGLHICFIPHIPQDLEAICEVLRATKEKHKRENISVAPYLQGDYGARFVGSIYQNSEFALVNRFHASILSFVAHTKVIGLPHSYCNRMYALYQNVGLEDCLIEARGEFKDKVIALLLDYPSKKANYQKSQKKTLEIYRNFFETNF